MSDNFEVDYLYPEEDQNKRASDYDEDSLAAADRQMEKARAFALSVTNSTDTENLVKVMSLYLNTFNQARWDEVGRASSSNLTLGQINSL